MGIGMFRSRAFRRQRGPLEVHCGCHSWEVGPGGTLGRARRQGADWPHGVVHRQLATAAIGGRQLRGYAREPFPGTRPWYNYPPRSRGASALGQGGRRRVPGRSSIRIACPGSYGPGGHAVDSSHRVLTTDQFAVGAQPGAVRDRLWGTPIVLTQYEPHQQRGLLGQWEFDDNGNPFVPQPGACAPGCICSQAGGGRPSQAEARPPSLFAAVGAS